MFEEQRNLFLKKLNADFDVVLRMIERKRAELSDKINVSYDLHITKTKNFAAGLLALDETMAEIKKAEIRVDLD